ncbi:MAG: MAE_28990/MAE_18760 family HEPN-like nuclease [Acutalibacter sp.]
MTANELRAELEAELAWRQEDLAFFKNQLNNISNDLEKDKYRKSLVLILYSHMEGYIKIALQTYIKFINAQNLPRKDAISGLVAASMNPEFNAYDNLDRKCNIFRRELPEDSSLHRFFRRVDFLDQLENFKNAPLIIEDSVINTESNLWYVVLQKNLYKIGLPVDMFQQYHRDIDALVNRRNSIAHGNSRSGVTAQEFLKWESKISHVMTDITILIYDYANRKQFIQPAPA